MAKLRKPNCSSPNTARAVQNSERPVRNLRFQERVKNLRLKVNRPVPVLEDQVVADCKRLIEAQNFVIQNASIPVLRAISNSSM
jgi:hypothetical protein